MKWFKNLGGFIGYILGALIILPLLLIAYNHFLINKNDAEKYLPEYMSDTAEIPLQIPAINFNKKDVRLNSTKMVTTALQTKNMGREDSRRLLIRYKIVFDRKTKKYFQITMIDLYNGFFGSIANQLIYARVNREDLANPSYGTKDKPLLVFSALGAKKPLTERRWTNQDPAGSDVIVDTTPDGYRYNATMYFIYVMPREEFKKRFTEK